MVRFRLCLRAANIGVDHYLILGDILGYYYDTKEVVHCVQKDLPATVIAGNHERMFLKGLKSKSTRTAYKKKYGYGLELAYEALDVADIKWIKALRPNAKIAKFGKVFDMYHGSPRHCDAYIYPDAPESVFVDCLSEGVDYTLTGHTHYALLQRISLNQIFINPGSVGQARDVSGFASWCTINTITDDILFYRTSYSLDSLLNKCDKFDPEKGYKRGVDKMNERVPYYHRLLITGCAGEIALAICRILRECNIADEIWCDISPEGGCEYYFDRLLKVDPANSEKMVSDFREIVLNNNIELIIPTVENELAELIGMDGLIRNADAKSLDCRYLFKQVQNCSILE